MQGIGSVLCLLLFLGFSFASNVRVNSTLSDAIANSYDGDVIIIPSGIYAGNGNTNLTLYGHNLTFQSESGNFNDVTIDCAGNNVSAVTVYYQPTPQNYTGVPLPAGNATTALSFIGITFANCASAFFLNATNTTGNNTVWIGRSQFTGNTGMYGPRSLGYGGGAIYAEGPVVLTVNNSVFDNCTAEAGAAILGVYGATMNITTSWFTNNTASDYGGAITLAFTGTSMFLSSSVFQHNTAPFGGAIYAYYNAYSSISASNFTSNTGYNAGGAVTVDSSATHISGCSFNSNAANTGGAVCSTSLHAAAIIDNSNFSNNVGHTAGGALVARNSASLFVTGSTITSNLAYAGGAVASMTSGYAMLTSVEAHGNKAQEGGAFYIQDKSTIFVQSSELSNNTAAMAGDTLYCLGSTMTFNDTSISVPSNKTYDQNGIYCTTQPGDNTWCTVHAYDSGDWSQVCANAPGTVIEKKMPGWEIAVIVIGVVLGALAIGFLVAYAISTKFEAPSRAHKIGSDERDRSDTF